MSRTSATPVSAAPARRTGSRSLHTAFRRFASLGSDAFQERTIEVEERGEEAVVSKEARVTEEVVVRKEAEQHTETVSDTVRKTEVDVEDERDTRVSGTGTTDRKP